MANEYRLSYTAADINTRLGKIDNLAEKSEVPKKLSDLTNDSNFATKNYVQGYAQPIGNYASRDEIPTDYITKDELDAKKYLTSYTETDPTVPAWAKATTKPTYTASEVSAIGYTKQTLTEEQKAQARKNIGAAADGEYEDGEDGFSPIATVTQTATGATISITDAKGTTTATITNGKDGKDGEDGETPEVTISYYNETSQNTQGIITSRYGVLIEGPKILNQDGTESENSAVVWNGEDGRTPVKGEDYWTDEDKQEIIADVLHEIPDVKGVLKGSTSTITPDEVRDAVLEGRDVVISYTDDTYGQIHFTGFVYKVKTLAVEASIITKNSTSFHRVTLNGNILTDKWTLNGAWIADYSDIPKKLPNPNALTFTGAVTGTYDGSSAMTLDIPTGGGGGATTWEDIGSKFEEGSVIFPEASLDYDEDSQSFVISDYVPVVAGKTYTVNWNGVEYVCTAIAMQIADNVVAAVLGDVGVMEGNPQTGEPFVMAFAPADMVEELGSGAELVVFDGSTEVTLSITEKIETITPIPEKYLPEYIRNCEDNMVIFESEYSAVDNDGDGNNDGNIVYCSETLDLTIGDSCIIEIDNNAYQCVAQDLSILSNGGVYGIAIGNAYHISGDDTHDTGEPFIFLYSPELMGMQQPGLTGMGMMDTPPGSGTFKITKKSQYIDPKYIKDMYYSDNRVVLPKTTPDDMPDMDGYTGIYGNPINLEDGKEYIVDFNGTEYTCIAQTVVGGDSVPMTVLGNVYAATGGTLGTANTGEPFVLVPNPIEYIEQGQPSVLIQILSTSITAVSSITVYESYIKKIDNKYIDAEWMATSKKNIIATYMPKQTVTFDDMLVEKYPFTTSQTNANILFNTPIIAGEVYTVIWNNVEYECTATTSDMVGDGGVILGDLSILDSSASSTSEPFLVGMSNYMIAIMSKDMSPTATFSVVQQEEICEKIPAKFLPDNIGGGSSLPEVTAEDEGAILRVVNGQWEIVKVLPVEEGEF